MSSKIDSKIYSTLLTSAILAFTISDASAICLPSSPLQSMTVSSNWGVRMRPNAKLPGGKPWFRPHNGFDLTTGKKNIPYFAAHDGMVTAADFESSQGNHINIDGTGQTAGVRTVAMHLSAMFVKPGDMVKAGQQIGVTGDTGAGIAGIPHLHFEVRINNGTTPQDPRGYFCPTPNDQGNLSDTYDLVTGELVPKKFPSVGTGQLTTQPGGIAVGAQPVSLPNGVVTYAPGGGIPSDAPFPMYTGRSTANFFAHEVESRFLNSTWMKTLVDPLYEWRLDPKNSGKDAPAIANPQLMLTREIAIMTAISNAMRLETRDIRTNTEAMSSAILSLQVGDYSESIMSVIKNNAKGN